eukprot:UN23626
MKGIESVKNRPNHHHSSSMGTLTSGAFDLLVGKIFDSDEEDGQDDDTHDKETNQNLVINIDHEHKKMDIIVNSSDISTDEPDAQSPDAFIDVKTPPIAEVQGACLLQDIVDQFQHDNQGYSRSCDNIVLSDAQSSEELLLINESNSRENVLVDRSRENILDSSRENINISLDSRETIIVDDEIPVNQRKKSQIMWIYVRIVP